MGMRINFLRRLFAGSPREESESPRTPPAKLAESEVARRFDALEKSVADAHNRAWDGHKWFTSVAISVIGIGISIVVWLANQNSRDATKEMRETVQRSISEMNENFKRLAGDANKKPFITISVSRDEELDGKVFEIAGGDPLPFHPLFLKNTGDRISDPISLRLYCSTPVSLGNTEWIETASGERDYPATFFYAGGPNGLRREGSFQIAAQDTATIQPQQGESFFPRTPTNRVMCKLLVFYGPGKPAEARFNINFK